MRLSAELLNDVIPRFLRDGWQVNAHAIGDRANAVVLDAFEKAANEGIDLRELRPRIEHAQIMREDDFERVGRLGSVFCDVLFFMLKYANVDFSHCEYPAHSCNR